jgi:hypothetical protein
MGVEMKLDSQANLASSTSGLLSPYTTTRVDQIQQGTLLRPDYNRPRVVAPEEQSTRGQLCQPRSTPGS